MDDVTRAWIAGAQAARAADVAALRAERLRLRDEAAKARGMGLRHAAEDTTARALGAGVCADIVEGMPLPAPPAPPQSPLPSPDGGTGPQGDGAPAGGLSVAEAGQALDLTDEVAALAHCPDGHHWRPGAGVERVRDIGDPGRPYLRRIVASDCPRCGFEWPISAEDA